MIVLKILGIILLIIIIVLLIALGIGYFWLMHKAKKVANTVGEEVTKTLVDLIKEKFNAYFNKNQTS